MADLPHHSGRWATCVKCANQMNPKTAYVSGPPREFLLRTCAVCGFEWVESCADAAPRD